jgi:hypothetical protein
MGIKLDLVMGEMAADIALLALSKRHTLLTVGFGLLKTRNALLAHAGPAANALPTLPLDWAGVRCRPLWLVHRREALW